MEESKHICNCEFCVDYRKYIWAVVMNCGCACHTADGMHGHESLCCEIPNGLKKNNPHPELMDKEMREKVINEFVIKHKN